MTRLVGLTGLAGAGKNEAANALVALGWKQAAFADKMRSAVLALDPIIETEWIWPGAGTGDGAPIDRYHVRLSEFVKDIGWDDAKRQFPEVRRLLQRFGTEAGRHIHGDDCWINALFKDHENRPDFYWDVDAAHNLVITDVRFDNEAEAIRARGGIVVEIVRPGLATLDGDHASEAGVSQDLIDAQILNDLDIEDLHRETADLITNWKEGMP